MHIALAKDEQVAQRVCEAATNMGKILSQTVRDYPEQLAGSACPGADGNSLKHATYSPPPGSAAVALTATHNALLTWLISLSAI